MAPQIGMPGCPDLENIARIDNGVIPFVRRCERNGMCIDKPWFEELSDYLTKEMSELEEQIIEYVPKETMFAFTSESLTDEYTDDATSEFNVDSPDQIAALLFKYLKTVDGTRIGEGIELSMTASGDRISTGKKQLERLKQQHPVIPLILQRREYAKLLTTYTRALPAAATWVPEIGQWVIYYKIGLTFTSTGRMTCSRLHQIPIRTEIGRLIRYGFFPRPGMAFISADYSGLELRILAHCAKERTMIEIFSNPKGDIHQRTQDGLNMPDTLDKIQKRLAAKRTSFGIVYGTTPLGLWLTLQSDGVPCTLEQCEGFQNQWLGTYYDVPPYIASHHHRARRYGFAYNIFGRVSPAPEFRSVHKRIAREGERRIQNYVIQSTATDVFKIGAAKIEEFCEEVRQGAFGEPCYCEPLLPIHDQVILETQQEYAEEIAECIGAIMSDAVELRVPLKVDYGVQERWEK